MIYIYFIIQQLPDMNLLQFLLLFLVNIKFALSQVPPTWQTSSYVQAGSFKVVDYVTCSCSVGNTSTPTASTSFTTAFGAPPNLGYGVSGYEGNYYINFRK
jgi:hypothetical protein